MRRHLSTTLLLFLLMGHCLAQRTLHDELGRKVVVPDTIHRIIPLSPSLTDMVYAMGAGGDVVGVSSYTKYPEEATKKPTVGEPLNPSIETIVALHPDLVLAIKDMNRAETVEQLEKLGIPVFVTDTRGLNDIYVSITNLGNALNRQHDAEVLVNRLRRREQAVRERVKGLPGPHILFVLWPDPVFTAGKGAFVTALIDIAGGKSVTDDLPQAWPQISLEAVIARKPDSLLLTHDSQVTLDDLKKKPGWSSMAAVKANRVFYVDDRIIHPSPVVFDALEDLAEQFHPSRTH